MARFREQQRQRSLNTCVQRRDGGNDGSQGDGQNIQRTTDKTQTTVDGGCKKYIPMRPEHKRRGKTRSDKTPVKSPDESLRIKTKHRCSWRCRDVQIHGGAAIAIAMVTRLACLEGLFLISVRYESRASGETIRGGFGPQSVSEAFCLCGDTDGNRKGHVREIESGRVERPACGIAVVAVRVTREPLSTPSDRAHASAVSGVTR